MVVNFRAHEISQNTRKLTRTSILIKKKSLMPDPHSIQIIQELRS
jgi:hypothetical protein